MRVIDTPGRVTAIRGDDLATLNLIAEGDGYFCGDLYSTGSPACMVAMFKRIAARGKPMWGIVNESLPVSDQIASMYERFGFELLGTLIVEGQDVFLDRNGERIPLELGPPTHGGRLYRKLCVESSQE